MASQNQYNSVLYKVIILLAFHALLWIGEIPEALHNMRKDHVELLTRHSGFTKTWDWALMYIVVICHASKSDQTREKEQWTSVATETNTQICPVHLLDNTQKSLNLSCCLETAMVKLSNAMREIYWSSNFCFQVYRYIAIWCIVDTVYVWVGVCTWDWHVGQMNRSWPGPLGSGEIAKQLQDLNKGTSLMDGVVAILPRGLTSLGGGPGSSGSFPGLPLSGPFPPGGGLASPGPGLLGSFTGNRTVSGACFPAVAFLSLVRHLQVLYLLSYQGTRNIHLQSFQLLCPCVSCVCCLCLVWTVTSQSRSWWI